MRENMQDTIRSMCSQENLTATYKEMFVGITDDEAAALAAAFRAAITTGRDRRKEFERLLKAAKRKYKQRDLTPALDEWELPDLDFDFPDDF